MVELGRGAVGHLLHDVMNDVGTTHVAPGRLERFEAQPQIRSRELGKHTVEGNVVVCIKHNTRICLTLQYAVPALC